MGNREALLDGAKRCLYEKGYARTTARDIATASGVSLAAIGYHFGSTEALLQAAMIDAIEEWGDEMERALAVGPGTDTAPMERFVAVWTRVIVSFATHRQLWMATFEIFTQIDHAPEVRRFLADAIHEGRFGLAALFTGREDAADARAVGSFYYALLVGMMAQWLVDPERAPSGEDLAAALRRIAAGSGTGVGRAPEET